jgi:hypothetical protein
MKKNKKLDIKSVSTVLVLLVVVLGVTFGLYSYNNKENFDTKDNLASSIGAGKNIFQQYSGLPNLQGLSEEEKSVIRTQIDDAINNLDIGMVDINKQLLDLGSKEKMLSNQIRAIDAEIATLSEGLKINDSVIVVLLNSASLAEILYNQKKDECSKLLNITNKQKTAKTTCNTQAAKLKKDLDSAVAKVASEKNKIPTLDYQRIVADKNYKEKAFACGKLLNTTPDQKKIKTECNTQANNLKKIAENLGVKFVEENKKVEIEAKVKQKKEEKIPLNAASVEIIRNQTYLRNINYDAQAVKDLLYPLKERFKEPIVGCMDQLAKNFNPQATKSDESCDYGGYEEEVVAPTTPVCDVQSALNYDSYVDTVSGEYADTTVCEFKPAESVEADVTTVNSGVISSIPCNVCNPNDTKAKELAKPMKIRAAVTHFGGPNDSTPGRNEKAAITGQPMKELPTESVYYVAWPLTEGEKAFGMPSVAQCLGEVQGSEKGNIAMNAHFRDNMAVIVSRTDDMGGKRSFVANVVDRGPAGADRLGTSKKFDMSRALYRALHIEEDIERRSKAGSPSELFDLELQLVSKAPGPGNMCHVNPTTFDIPQHGYKY